MEMFFNLLFKDITCFFFYFVQESQSLVLISTQMEPDLQLVDKVW